MEERKGEKIIFNIFSVLLLAFSLYLTATYFAGINVRMLQAVEDFGRTLVYHFLGYIDKTHLMQTTVQEIPSDMDVVLPITWEEFKAKMQMFGRLLVTKEHLSAYFTRVGKLISSIGITCMALIIPLSLLFLITWLSYRKVDNEHGKKSYALDIWFSLEDIFYYPIKKFVCLYVRFIKRNKGYLISFLIVWAYNLNLITVALEALAWILWVCFSFQFGNIFVQVAKLAVDLSVPFTFLPKWALFTIGFLIFDFFRKRKGYDRLEDGEEENKRFLLENTGNYIITGPPRYGKTLTETDMGISQDIVFREVAQEKSMEHHMEFPFFQWGILEQSIKAMRKNLYIFGLTFIREWIPTMEYFFTYRAIINPMQYETALKKLKTWGYKGDDFIFNYDYKRHGLTYNNGLKVMTLFKSIELYAEEYHIYTHPSPLMVGNFPIKSRKMWKDFGNYPILKVDYFKKSPEELEAISEFNHIVNHDALRLGRQKDPNGIFNDAYDMGVLNLSELGKELGNQITNRGKDKKAEDDKCNPNNDLWTVNAKMISHGCTIDYFTYFRILSDEQRAMSILADFREICSELKILKKYEEKIRMPFFAWEALAFKIAQGIMKKLVLFFKSRHGKMTLFFYICLRLYSLIFNHYMRIYNTFASYKQDVIIMDQSKGETMTNGKVWKYTISRKKICSDVYATGFFFPYYHEKWKRSQVGGLNSTPQFTGLDPTVSQMRFMKSHFNEQVFEYFGIAG